MSQETTDQSLFKPYYRIETPRLVVRSAYPDDAEGVYRLLGSPENNPHTPVDPSLSAEVFARRIARWKEASERGESAFMVIADRQTGELVGYGGFQSLPHKPALDGSGRQVLVGDIGILIDKQHWRKGYATEATCATTEFAFDYFGCGFINMDTEEFNEPLRSLMRSLGLSYRETRKPSWRDKDAFFLYYEWDKDMWEKAKAEMKANGRWPL